MKKNVIKQIILYLFICTFLYVFCLCVLNLNGTTETRYKTETETITEPKVYVTTYGEKYHSSDCFYLKSSHSKGLYEARKQGYTACNYCNGMSDETIDVDYDTEISYEADKRNDIRAIPIALVIGIITYLGVKYCIKNYIEMLAILMYKNR